MLWPLDALLAFEVTSELEFEYRFLHLHMALKSLKDSQQAQLQVDANGTLEIDAGPGRRGYALVDTVLLANVRRACHGGHATAVMAAVCDEMEAAILERRGQFPMQRSEDADRGRQMDLPA